jgi:hypothetical protein
LWRARKRRNEKLGATNRPLGVRFIQRDSSNSSA